MHRSLVVLAAFVLDFGATYAGVKAILAANQRLPFRTANWGLVLNLFGGTALLLVVFTDNIPAFVAGCLGSYAADYLATRRGSHEVQR